MNDDEDTVSTAKSISRLLLHDTRKFYSCYGTRRYLTLRTFSRIHHNRADFGSITGELFRDTVIDALICSISAGNAIASYLTGGDLLKERVNLFAVTGFIVAGVTVGVVQFPAEVAIDTWPTIRCGS